MKVEKLPKYALETEKVLLEFDSIQLPFHPLKQKNRVNVLNSLVSTS